MTAKKPYKGDLTELNPYDQRIYPKHWAVAQSLLSGEPVLWADVYEETGAGNRTLGIVKKHLADCGVELRRLRNEDREIVYIASAGASAKKVEAIPLAMA
jgi:hypothetical protein